MRLHHSLKTNESVTRFTSGELTRGKYELKARIPIAAYLLVLTAGGLQAQSPEGEADVIYINGRIYTVDTDRPWAEALALRDGKFLAVGSNGDITTLASDDTESIDLNGRMVMPGLHDAHVHLEIGGITQAHECTLSEGANQQQIVEILSSCESLRPGGWITSSAIIPFIFPDTRMTNDFLNEAFPDTPVFLTDYSFHHGLANDKALELAGIDDDTPSPAGGIVMRDPTTGRATGELVETATALVYKVLPPYDDETYVEALRHSIRLNNSLGVTSVQETSANRRILDILNRLDTDGGLSLNVATHIVWRNESFSGSTAPELAAMRSDAADYATRHVHTDFVKLWIDGAPLAPNITVAGLDEKGDIDQEWLLYTQEELNRIIASVDARGVSAKMHVAAAGSARAALNAIEYARSANGDSGPMHELVHAADVHDDDIARMQALGAIAEMSPAVWYIVMAGSDEPPDSWDFDAMKEAGVTVTIGTDTLYHAELFPALEGILTRPDSTIDLTWGLEALTINGARVTRLDDRIGSIEEGKDANFIILDRNLFEIPVEEIGETRVLRTIFEGEVVHHSGQDL